MVWGQCLLLKTNKQTLGNEKFKKPLKKYVKRLKQCMFYRSEESSRTPLQSAIKSVFYFAVVAPKTTKINIGVTVLLPVFLSLKRANTCLSLSPSLLFPRKKTKDTEIIWSASGLPLIWSKAAGTAAGQLHPKFLFCLMPSSICHLN